MSLTTISVTDMHCAACINKIRNALDFDRVAAIYFNPARRQVFVEHDDDADVVCDDVQCVIGLADQVN